MLSLILAVALALASAQLPPNLNAPIVDEAPAPVGSWQAGADGGVFALAGAPFLGSAFGVSAAPVFAIRRSDPGYLLFAEDGGVFAYGATFRGSAYHEMPDHHSMVAVEMYPTGYVLTDDAGNRYRCERACVPEAELVVIQLRTVWDRLAACESDETWNINTGNGYYGGLQWAPSTWSRWRDADDPAQAHHATREQQIAAAERLLAADGGHFYAWPGCRRALGLP